MSREIVLEVARGVLTSVARALHVSIGDDHIITIACLGKKRVMVTPETITNIELHPRLCIYFGFEHKPYKLFLMGSKPQLLELMMHEKEFGPHWSQVN